MIVFIAGITSDIGRYICEKFIEKGHSVLGTYRKIEDNSLVSKIEATGGRLYYCDFSDVNSIRECIKSIRQDNIIWDVLISAVGVMEPIEKFVDVDFDKWENNIYINAISQLRFLHELLNRRSERATVFFMTSKGVNDAFPKHSAYCISKIFLVKMCELLDDEIDDCKFIAFNPGFIQTKIINQEPEAYKSRGINVTDEDYNKKELNKVWKFIEWSLGTEKNVISGRNFFIKYDRWEEKDFCKFLLKSADTYKLRRFRDDWLDINK